MKRIISASRRTDIPAFHGEWFMKCIEDGFVISTNPSNNQTYKISLLPQDVNCLVFWSKNFIPFLDNLNKLASLGYKFFFNYTITGLSKIFEPNVENFDNTVNNLIELSKQFGIDSINWRYDPIIFSNTTDYNFHLDTFDKISTKLTGYVNRCVFSFVYNYSKIIPRFKSLEYSGIFVNDEPQEVKIKLSRELSQIAKQKGIKMFTCCEDFVTGDNIEKSSCIDLNAIKRITGEDTFQKQSSTSRKSCGCYTSTDIGFYNTCKHNCVYCYANK